MEIGKSIRVVIVEPVESPTPGRDDPGAGGESRHPSSEKPSGCKDHATVFFGEPSFGGGPSV